MKYNNELLNRYMLKDYIEKENRINISEKLMVFKMRNHISELNEEKILFIENMKTMNKKENIYSKKGSGLYFFKAGDSIIQLDVEVEDKVCIKPYLIYEEFEVKNDFMKVIELDQLLYEELERIGLQ